MGASLAETDSVERALRGAVGHVRRITGNADDDTTAGTLHLRASYSSNTAPPTPVSSSQMTPAINTYSAATKEAKHHGDS